MLHGAGKGEPWRRVRALVLAASLAACGSRTGLNETKRVETALPEPADASACPLPAPACVIAAQDPCAAPIAASAVCVGSAWECPAGGHFYARAAPSSDVCLPFHDPSTGIGKLGPWGLGSLVRIPTDDGRCLWVADYVFFDNSPPAFNIAFLADPIAPFGTCPRRSVIVPTEIVTLPAGTDPVIRVQITGGYRLGGATHVLYRVFRQDVSAGYGVVELGSGVGRWNQSTGRVDIPTVQAPFPWGLDLDLGDAMMAAGDGLHEYVLGCALQGPGNARSCELARLDANDRVELWSHTNTWIASTQAADGQAFFSSGPWISSLVATATGVEHIFADPFGSVLGRHLAPVFTGPWSGGPTLVSCDLPGADPKAYCAGPVVHTEMEDPMSPGESVVVYAVGTTGAMTTRVDDYWPRLVWVR